MHYGRCVSGELYCFFHFKLLSRYGFSACKRYILMFLGVNLSFVINCTKNVFFFFALFQGQQRERDKLHDKYVRLVFYCAYRESR